MILPPHDEAARLAALESYDILDTEAEQAYDDITHLASQICGTPIALMSLVDADRQWFKSKVGVEASETPRDLAFCAHAIQEPEELFIVGDATLDSRFSSNPLVTADPNIRFYAGAPLTTAAGQALGTLCVIDRIPRRLDQQQEESLRALSRMIIAQLELRLARDRAEAADRAKMSFLANMSHEIRTPLNAVLGLSELMTIEAHGPLGDARYREYADDIHSAGSHLLELINEVLDFSALEADRMRLHEEPVAVSELIQRVSRMLAVHALEKGVTVEEAVPPSLPVLMADERRFKQVLINLVNNAIKFTPSGGSVTIGAEVVNGGLRVTIADTGIGMTADEIDVALTAFGQAATDSAAREGTGLGLPITKRLVEAHGGTFTLESAPGRGTTAVIELPAGRLLDRAA